jgi:hypothetical protein
MFEKLSSSSLIVIDKVEDLSQMQALVSTENKFEKLNISLQSDIGQKQPINQDILEQLVNIKYMKLVELKISMEMCSINDKHVIVIAEALEKNRQMKSLSLSFWKYLLPNLVITFLRLDSKRY